MLSLTHGSNSSLTPISTHLISHDGQAAVFLSFQTLLFYYYPSIIHWPNGSIQSFVSFPISPLKLIPSFSRMRVYMIRTKIYWGLGKLEMKTKLPYLPYKFILCSISRFLTLFCEFSFNTQFTCFTMTHT